MIAKTNHIKTLARIFLFHEPYYWISYSYEE